MAPLNKRKRPDRTQSHDGTESRPSPHRPQNMSLAQQNPHSTELPNRRGNSQNSRGDRRSNRGGYRGNTPRASPTPQRNGAETSASAANATSTPTPRSQNTAMNPPPVPQTQSAPSQPAPSNPPTPQIQPAPSNPPTPQIQPAPTQPKQANLAQPTPAQPAPPPRKRHFPHKWVTDERVKAWESTGKAAVIADAVKDNTLTIGEVFQDIVRSGLLGRISPQSAGETVREILWQVKELDCGINSAEFFCDVISTAFCAPEDLDNPALVQIIVNTWISPQIIREVLEADVLMKLGFVRNTFYRKFIRQSTDTYYRQSAYNRLVEETEGYSKLLTEYFAMGNRGAPTATMVEEAFTRIKALIGAFDMDVGRVLDVTLDVCANQLVANGTFFIKFLRMSSWWPEEKTYPGLETTTLQIQSLPSWALPGSETWAYTDEEREQLAAAKKERDTRFWKRVQEIGTRAYFELGSRRVLHPEVINDSNKDSFGLSDEDVAWIKKNGELPPNGNTTAAQLLGYKLQYYASDRRGENETLPSNLIYLTALLIKIGFISLRDIYPYLYPSDDDMKDLKEKLMKEKAEREKKMLPSGGTNALAMAGALTDDTLPAPVQRFREAEAKTTASRNETPTPAAGTPAADEEPKANLPEPADQKRMLLESLLCFGCLPEALYLLGRFPWLLDGYPSLLPFLFRIFDRSISKICEDMDTVPRLEGIDAPEIRAEAPKQAKGPLMREPLDPCKMKRWMDIEKREAGNASKAGGDLFDFQFYWKDWDDNVPVCQSVDDLFLFCNTLLNFAGLKIGSDPTLLQKLARIGKKSLMENPSEENYNRWIALSKRLLVPALSLTERMSGSLNQVWELIKMFKISTRYNIYAEWFQGQTSRKPDIKVAFDRATAETKDTLKRISRTNTRQMGRVLAKTAHYAPGVVFRVTLSQLESYSNLVDVVVEGVRYLTYIGYDILTWSLLTSLSAQGRNRLQGDGMLTSPWLQALSAFAGKSAKRYTLVNPVPIVQYVISRLNKGDTTDLELIEQLLASCTGIRSDVDYTEIQTQGMAGGDKLRTQIWQTLHDDRHKSGTIQAAKRLLNHLIENDLVGRLIILIARERDAYAHREGNQDAPLKVVTNNIDKIHRVFVQLLEGLRHNLSVKEFDAAVPDLVKLRGRFGIQDAPAWHIVRDSISHHMLEYDENKKAEVQKAASEPPKTNGDADAMEVDTPKESGEATAPPKQENDGQVKAEAEDVKMEDGAPPAAPVTVPAPEDHRHPILKALAADLRPTLPPDFEKNMNLAFYTRFWQLSLSDLFVPATAYEQEIKRQNDAIAMARADRSDVSSAGKKRRDNEIRIHTEIADGLRNEMKARITAHANVKSALLKEKDEWFSAFPISAGEVVHDAIIEHCFWPRIIHSPMDALYTHRMLMFLHNNGTPGFRTLQLLDQIFRSNMLYHAVFTLTASETENLGRFLNEVLKDLARWHEDADTYHKAAHGSKNNLPGFAMKLNPDKTAANLLGYEDFRRLLYKWHSNLCTALRSLLTDKEYMCIRNGTILLKTISQTFPTVNWMGKALLDCFTEIAQHEERKDLKLMANSSIPNLTKREKSWILPQAFRLVSTYDISEAIRAVAFSQPSSPPSLCVVVYVHKVGVATSAAPRPTLSAPRAAPGPMGLARGAGSHSTSTSTVTSVSTLAPTSAVSSKQSRFRSKSHVQQKQQAYTTPKGDGASAGARQSASRATSTQANTPQPSAPQAGSSTPATLNAAAPDFKPKVDSSQTYKRPINDLIRQRTQELIRNRNGAMKPTETNPRRPDEGETEPAKDTSAAAASEQAPATDAPQPETFQDQARPSSRQSDGKQSGRLSPGPQTGPPRYDNARGPPNQRQPHALPTRPEAPPPRGRGAQRMDDRPQDYRGYGRYDTRGPPPNPDYGRLERPEGPRDGYDLRRESPNRRPRPRSRSPMQERMVMDREREYVPREYPDERTMRPPPRDGRGPLPPQAWRDEPQSMRQRPMDSRGPPISMDSRTRPMGPPPVHVASAGRETPMHSERPPHMDMDRNGINPDRAARLMGDEPRSRAENPRVDTRRDRGSRPHSPVRRMDDRGPQSFPTSRHDMRDDRLPPPDRTLSGSFPPPSRDRRDEPGANAPTGPRGGREYPEPSRSRELFSSPNSAPRGPIDPSHGRLNQDYGPPPPRVQQDPNYGRLNQDIPSGPRSRNAPRTGSRNFTAPSPGVPSSPAHERPPSGSFERRNDRDRREMEPLSGPPSGEDVAVHPSRLANLMQPPPLDTVNVPSYAPSGPRSSGRSSMNAPGGPNPSSRGPPGGPGDRRSEREDKRFAGLNSVLNPSSGNGGAPSPRDERPSDRFPVRNNRPRGGTGTSGPSPANSQPGTPNPHGQRPMELMPGDDGRGRLRGPDNGRVPRDPSGAMPGQERSKRSHRSRSRSPHRSERRKDDGGGMPRRREDKERGEPREMREPREPREPRELRGERRGTRASGPLPPQQMPPPGGDMTGGGYGGGPQGGPVDWNQGDGGRQSRGMDRRDDRRKRRGGGVHDDGGHESKRLRKSM